MSLIIRCQTSQGMHRLTFPSKNATFGDLQSAIQSKYAISPDAQVISKTRPNAPEFIENVSSDTKLSDINLKHGTIIYLIMVDNQINSFKEKQKAQQAPQDSNSMDTDDNDEEKTSNNNNTKSGTYQLKPMAKRKKKGPSKMKLDELKHDEVVDSGPKHIPFHEFIQERQRKFAKTQPWNIDPPKPDYKRMLYDIMRFCDFFE